jgi:phosphoglycolate phosphatase-like HAD superfamily hydrolase
LIQGGFGPHFFFVTEETIMYIFDIDGTLADPEERIHHIIGPHKDWDTYDSLVHTDKPINAIITLAQCLYRHEFEIMLLTGRSDRVREDTEDWLWMHDVPYDHLIMRKEGDRREDTIVKVENLDQFLLENPGYTVQTIFEDRKRLAEAFRDKGFHVCHVAEGDF